MTSRSRRSVISACFVCLFSLATYVSYAQIPKPVKQLTVFDANGKNMGTVLSLGQTSPVVALTVNGHLAVFGVLRNSFEGEFLYFESSDCSGTPFLLVRESNATDEFLALAAVVPPGNTVWVRDPLNVIQTVTVRSQLVNPRFTPSCQTISANAIQAVGALGPVINLDNFFTPPFSVR